MIVARKEQILFQTGHDHGTGPRRVSECEMGARARRDVWQTGGVTSGRIIIGWRVGT
jgi:hypothetical protein